MVKVSFKKNGTYDNLYAIDRAGNRTDINETIVIDTTTPELNVFANAYTGSTVQKFKNNSWVVADSVKIEFERDEANEYYYSTNGIDWIAIPKTNNVSISPSSSIGYTTKTVTIKAVRKNNGLEKLSDVYTVNVAKQLLR